MDKDADQNRFILIGGLVIAGLVFLIILLAVNKPKRVSLNQENLSLDNSGLNLAGSGKQSSLSKGHYQDNTCGISFDIPQNWQESDQVPSLPQPALSAISFDQGASQTSTAKNSILSFICYDAAEYSFDQFLSQSPSQNQTASMTIGNQKWQRVGTFAYTTKGKYLLIFQMFFTKFDVKPEASYEQEFMKILGSVK